MDYPFPFERVSKNGSFMHGMVNRSIEHFLRATYGDAIWHEIAQAGGIDAAGFNGMRQYPDDITQAMLQAASATLGKTACDILEDTGAWLVQIEAMRRLLRFSGGKFSEFVLALEELPARARLVLPDLEIPPLMVAQIEPDVYRIYGEGWGGLLWIVSGALRGMADDYGVLALIEAGGAGVEMRVLMQEYTQGRPFAFAPATISGQG
ncbi:heme NO-binding domain-containing protein [Paracoccus sp. DMF-8]|uniref:heme NO-binding domain-containing protein n=1 Tax=Paracoccus sp. DMF-8 TaxID=3019445 RepID=UPI0023E80E69|nr:heme NO-binding domain-containing protein [Paracoccus sp. DMF-8]MDF3605952.1 heme NO-binding domain-containing protein [Paracoccus sp. DMF-8]